MGYRIERHETPETALRRVAAEQIGKGLDEMRDTALPRAEAIHQLRKRCKKLRGLMRLVRPALGEDAYHRENAWYRDTARRVAGLRDADVLVETLETLIEDAIDPASAEAARGVLAPMRVGLARDTVDGGARELAEIEVALQEGRARLDSLTLDAGGFAVLAGGLKKTYRRGRKRMRSAAANPVPETLHDWRKRVKYHWYHVRLLENVWPGPMKARRHELKRLSDVLGDDHDLAVLDRTLRGPDPGTPDTEALAPVLETIAARRDALQGHAFRLGRRVFAEKPKRLVRRMEGYWDAWQADPVAD